MCSGETIRLSDSGRVAVEFVQVMFIQDLKTCWHLILFLAYCGQAGVPSIFSLAYLEFRELIQIEKRWSVQSIVLLCCTKP